jgi:hypothetical protein
MHNELESSTLKTWDENRIALYFEKKTKNSFNKSQMARQSQKKKLWHIPE